MRRLALSILALSSILVLAVPAYPQTDCAVPMAVFIQCSGPNGCNQGVAVLRPYFGYNETCLDSTYVWCCSTQIQDYNDTGVSCSDFCDSSLRALLKDPDASEFSLTHTLWAKDCSGYYRPFARSWDAPPQKLIDLRPSRIDLSGLGG